MTDGTVSFAQVDQVCFIKMSGDIKYTLGGGFNWLHNQLSEDASLKSIVIDMNDTTYADSTTLGMLGKIARFHLSRFNKKPLLICSNTDLLTIINGMGFNTVFQIIDEWAEEPPQFEPLPGDAFTPPDVHLLWEAHKTLSDMNAKNKNEFKDVMKVFEAEM